MPIDKVTSVQYAAQITAGVNGRDSTIDTTVGPIPDAAIFPQSVVLEQQNDRARKLSFLLSLANVDEFTGFETDLEGIVYNEGQTRSTGAKANVTELFSRSAEPKADLNVQRGYPIASQIDEATGSTIVFVASEARVMTYAQRQSFFNLRTQRYELSVPLVSTVEGAGARVGPNRVNRPLRPLAGFDSMTNPLAATGGRDTETNAELIARYLIAILGRQTGVPNGITRVALADFPDVSGLKVVYGNNPMLLRAATDAGAVDVWIKGSVLRSNAENLPFPGVGQLIPVSIPPLVSVVSVKSGATYDEGTDYDVVFDLSGVSRSPREASGIRFRAGGPNALPAIGDPVTINYTYDGLIRDLQAGFTDDETLELGRDILFRRGIEVPIAHAANLTTTQGFSVSSILTKVQVADLTFVNTLGLGEPIQGSDIQGVVRAITGVDNYVITRLSRASAAGGAGDLSLADNEYPALAAVNLTVSTT